MKTILKMIVVGVLCSIVVGCAVEPIYPRPYHAPSYSSPGPGWEWSLHPREGWGWYHPIHGWHRGW